MHSWSFTESQYTTNKYHNNYKNTEALTVVLIDFYNLCKKRLEFLLLPYFQNMLFFSYLQITFFMNLCEHIDISTGKFVLLMG